MAIITAYGFSETSSESFGKLISYPSIISPTEILTSTTTIVYFDRGMKLNEDLTSPLNYFFNSPSGAVPVTVLSVENEDVAEPTYVTLTSSEFTNGAAYEVYARYIVDPEDVAIDGIAYPVTGIGEAPTIVNVVATTRNSFEIEFSETMYENSIIENHSKYQFDKGLIVVSAELIPPGNKVSLVTTDQISGELYTLTIVTS